MQTDCARAIRLLAWVSQYAIRKYAETLETIPRTLAENAGQVRRPCGTLPASLRLVGRPRTLRAAPSPRCPLRAAAYCAVKSACARSQQDSTSTVSDLYAAHTAGNLNCGVNVEAGGAPPLPPPGPRTRALLPRAVAPPATVAIDQARLLATVAIDSTVAIDGVAAGELFFVGCFGLNSGLRSELIVSSGGLGWAGTMDMLQAKVLDHLVSKVISGRAYSQSV